MSMTRPEGRYANRTRCIAASRGWAPPLAWDDIDTDAAPTGVYVPPTTITAILTEQQAKRAADLEHAVEHGHTLGRVCADLGISPKSLQRWCQRHDQRDAWESLSSRTRTSSNGLVGRGAA